MGDAVMAIFNAPLAQEGHALSAVRAALAIRTRWRASTPPGNRRPASSIRYRINVGEAVVGNVGTPAQ